MYRRLRDTEDRVRELREMTDVDIVHALAGASRVHDPLLANVLATEAENRMRRAGVAAAKAPECIITLDRDGRVTYVNDTALQILGCDRCDIIGRVAWEAIQVFDERGARLGKRDRPSFIALKEAREARGYVDLQRQDGALLRCVYLAAPVLREGGVEGAVVVFHRALSDDPYF